MEAVLYMQRTRMRYDRCLPGSLQGSAVYLLRLGEGAVREQRMQRAVLGTLAGLTVRKWMQRVVLGALAGCGP